MATWITPKTDWKDGDFFDKDDFNRITGNITYLHDLWLMLGKYNFTFKSMGSPVTVYSTTAWNYVYFNNLQYNINFMWDNLFGLWDPREEFTYEENGKFCNAFELNYIERNCQSVYTELQALIVGIRKIPFRLGQYKTRI